jgi:hypothetical protein
LVAPGAKSVAEVNNDLAWISVAFAIFNTYMLLERDDQPGGVRGVPHLGSHRDLAGDRQLLVEQCNADHDD